MIICSCNGFSDRDVRDCLGDADCRMTVSQVYSALGHTPCCGTCAHTIRSLIAESHGNQCHACPVRAQLEAAEQRALASRPAYDFLMAAE